MVLVVAQSESETAKVLKEFIEPMTVEFQRRALLNLSETHDDECTHLFLINIYLLSHIIRDKLAFYLNQQLFNVMLELA